MAVITTVSASPRIAVRSSFQNSSCSGDRRSSPSLDSLTVLNCTRPPFQMSLLSDPQFGPTLTLANNTYTAIGVLGENHAQDVRLGVRNLAGISNITYMLVDGGMSVAFGAKWTIDPGIVLKMGGSITINGALIADGKPDSLIVFTSIHDDAHGGDTNNDGALTSPARGNWSYIEFASISDDVSTVLDHCRFRYGGGDFTSGSGVMRFVNAGPTVTNSRFTMTTRYAAVIAGNSTPTFTDCTFEDGTGAPVRMSLVSEPTFSGWLPVLRTRSFETS